MRNVCLSGRSWSRTFVETVAAAVGSGGTVGRGWIFDATCAGEETLISRYRVCSELAGSQSERVLTLAAHSTLPSVSACPLRPPHFPLRHPVSPEPPFSSLRPAPSVLPLPTAQTTPAADHIRLWRKLRRSSPSEPTFQFFFFSLCRPKVS